VYGLNVSGTIGELMLLTSLRYGISGGEGSNISRSVGVLFFFLDTCSRKLSVGL
jgi:hypothetical protein